LSLLSVGMTTEMPMAIRIRVKRQIDFIITFAG
jgi:hypothetical protein